MKSFVARRDPKNAGQCEGGGDTKGVGVKERRVTSAKQLTFDEATGITTQTLKATTPSITQKDEALQRSSMSALEKKTIQGNATRTRSRPQLTLPAKPRPSGRGKDFKESGKSEIGEVINKVTKRATPQKSSQKEKKMDAPNEQKQTSGMKREQGGVEETTMSRSLVSSGFTSARGSTIQISKEAIEAVKKLCFDEEEEELDAKAAIDAKRKRPSENSHPTGFKLPRTKGSKFTVPSKRESTSSISSMTIPPRSSTGNISNHIAPLNRRSTFSEWKRQENDLVSTKGSDRDSLHDRRVTLGAVMEQRRLGRRCSKGWRPVHSLPTQDASEVKEESPLEKLLLEPFDASRVMCPKKAAAHVFNSGASTLSMYGAMIDLGMRPTLQWVKRQYQWIVWRLSGFMTEETTALTADNVFLELKYRFSAEKSGAKSFSILKDLADSGAVKSAVLLVADIHPGDSPGAERVEMSDGWSLLVAEIDEQLREKCQMEEIVIGSLLFVGHLAVQRVTSGALETQILSNSCVPVARDTPIGPAATGSFFLPLSSIHAHGGPVAITWLCVYRRYPVLFQHRGPNGCWEYLTMKQHQQRLEEYEKEMNRIQSTAQEIVQEEERKYFKAVLQKKRAGDYVDPIELLYAECYISESEPTELTAARREELASYKIEREKSMELHVAQEIERLKQDGQSKVPLEIPRLTLLVTEVTRTTNPSSKPACLHVWTRTTPSSHAFREGDVYEFRDLDLDASQDCQTLHAGKHSYFDKISSVAQLPANLSVHFIPRTPVSHFTDLGQGDLYDIEAFVLPGDRSRALVCIDARTEMLDTSVSFILIPIDPFGTLSHLRAYQIWSLTDLYLVSFCAEDATVVTRVTEKTACVPLKPPEKLEKLKEQYKLKRRTLDAHVAQLLACL